MEDAREKGWQEEKKAVAKNLLDMGVLTVEQIAAVSGLDLE